MAEMKTLTIGGVKFTLVDGEAVHFTEQTLTEKQKAKTLENLGITKEELVEDVLAALPVYDGEVVSV